MNTIEHPWRNGGDNSKRPSVSIVSPNLVLVVSDGDTDADGSQRVGSIDPDSGQSHTSLRRSNGWKGPQEYVDSEVIPFFVLPLNWSKVTGLSATLGDMAKLSYGKRTVYAIFADYGPQDLIGEMSINAIESLGGNPWNSDGTRIVRGIAHGVTYEIKPGTSNLSKTIDFKSIQEYGKELFESESSPVLTPPPDNTEWSELKIGMSGKGVELLQKELNAHFDARLDVDGAFGKLTEIAVKKAEEAMQLPINGTADQDFWKRMGTLKGVLKDITPGPTLVVDAKNRNVIPFAEQCPAIPTKWQYQSGWPQGAILHFTAGRDKPKETLDYLGRVGFPCIVMGRDGKVYQGFPVNRGGSHSGTYHHDYSFGLEVCAAGICTKLNEHQFKTWYGEVLPDSEMRYVPRNGSRREGWYQKYTPEQEVSIVKLFLWYKWADPTGRFSFDKVLGHDEACDQAGFPGAKNDPGGALSMTMPEFRDLLKKKWKELQSWTREQQGAYLGYPGELPEDEHPHPNLPSRIKLHLVRKGHEDAQGNEVVALSAHYGDFKPIGTVHAVTGQYYAQVFRKGGTVEKAGSMEPIPQGKYTLGKPEWATSPHVYEGDCGNGVGPVWISIDKTFESERGAFGIHLDLGVHGTAGCVGISTANNYADMEKVISWWKDPETAPTELTVDWGV